jgi:hypothetical protein
MQMKNFFLVIPVMCVMLSCTGKSGTVETDQNPGEVAVAVFNALTSGDVQVVKDNIYFPDEIETISFGKYLDMAVASEKFAERTKGYDADYRIISEKIDGDSAHVVLAGMTALKQKTRFNVLVIKIDGKWKVDGHFSVFHRQSE